jgi:hypothetical protein
MKNETYLVTSQYFTYRTIYLQLVGLIYERSVEALRPEPECSSGLRDPNGDSLTVFDTVREGGLLFGPLPSADPGSSARRVPPNTQRKIWLTVKCANSGFVPFVPLRGCFARRG